MKKLFMTAMALVMCLAGKAQLVEVTSVDRVALPENIVSEIATVSPDGTYAVVGQMGGNTLYKVDFATGNASVLSTNGNPANVMISPDGLNVVYRTSSWNNNLRYTGLNYINVTEGVERQLVKPSRHLNAGVAVSNAGISTVEGGKARTKSFNGSKASQMPVASINYGHLDITAGGKTTTIDPQGRGSYLWPSVSPDGTKVVYTLSGAGTFVCDLDGSNVKALGRMHAPRWMGNNLIVGMDDYDNGQQITASQVVVSDLAGTRQAISPAGHIAIYPSATADGHAVAYSTTEGELYIINIK